MRTGMQGRIPRIRTARIQGMNCDGRNPDHCITAKNKLPYKRHVSLSLMEGAFYITA